MSDLVIFEVGMRDIDGRYTEFMKSPDRKQVDDYSDLMNDVVDECFEIVKLEKSYKLLTTTPHIVKRNT